MELKANLPHFDELDVEFSQNCRMVYDILISNFNKRIKLIEVLRDDLYDFINKGMRSNKNLELSKSSRVDGSYPQKKGDQIKKFELDADYGDIGFFTLIDLQNKSNKNSGIRIEIAFGLEEINWYIGQFEDFKLGDEYFNYNFYKNVKSKFPKHPLYNVSIAFPNKPGVEDSDGDKWIKISVNFKDLAPKNNQALIIKIQRELKAKVLDPMIVTLKKNNWG